MEEEEGMQSPPEGPKEKEGTTEGSVDQEEEESAKSSVCSSHKKIKVEDEEMEVEVVEGEDEEERGRRGEDEGDSTSQSVKRTSCREKGSTPGVIVAPSGSSEAPSSPPDAPSPPLGSSSSLVGPLSPPVAPGGLRLVSSLATDPAGPSFPGPLSHYLLPSGPLHPSTAAFSAAAAAAFAAASRLISLPPPANARAPPAPDPTPPLGQIGGQPTAEANQVRKVAVFVCAPCGIKFSSASTLEAHQTYYCSHRSTTPTPAPASRPQPPPTPSATIQDGKESPETPIGVRSGGSEAEDSRPLSAEAKVMADEERRSPASEEGCPPAKVPRVMRLFPCPHCSYSADKRASLSRHMRMHIVPTSTVPVSAASTPPPPLLANTTPPIVTPTPPLGSTVQVHSLLQQGVSPGSSTVDSASSPTPDPALPPPPLDIDRYCKECDIRFSSVKTYRAHKQHYCSTRHSGAKALPETPQADGKREPGDLSRSPVAAATAPAAPPSGLQVKQQLLQPPFVALPTSPVVLVPYAFLQSASLVVAGTPAPSGACILLPDGSLRPVSPVPGLIRGPSPSVSGPLPSSTPLDSAPPPSAPAIAPVSTPKAKEVESQPAPTAPSPQPLHPGSSPAPLDLSLRREELSNSESQSARVPHRTSSNSSNSNSQDSRRYMKQAFEEMEAHQQRQQISRRPLSSDPKGPCGPHSQQSADCVSPASSSSTASSPGPKARPSRPNGIPKGGPHTQVSLPAPTPPPALPSNPILQQFGGGALEGLGMANFLLAAYAAAAAASAGPEGMAKAAAAAISGAGNTAATAAQGALPFLLNPELALRMFLPPTRVTSPQAQPPVGPRLSSVAPTQPPVAPQILVKQGVSKCVECNIVFCRHENFLAHKRHYCSARLTPQVAAQSPSVGGVGQEDEHPPPPQGGQAPGAIPSSPNTPLLQFICVACGVKFTSLDNLQTHQTHYCPVKRDNGPPQQLSPPTPADRIIKCPKCKLPVDEKAPSSHQCPVSSSNMIASSSDGCWKCPCCSVVSPTASAAQRHLESHGAVRAFRCAVCGYRGNTLRGIRTHVRSAHPEQQRRDGREGQHSSPSEEHLIACILEDETEVAPMVPVATADVLASRSTTPATDSDDASGAGGERMHYCEVCGYSSTYKGNVVRHLKLVHKCSNPGGPTEEGVMGPGIVKRENEDSRSPGPKTGDPGVNGHREDVEDDDDEDMGLRAESLVKVEMLEVDEEECQSDVRSEVIEQGVSVKREVSADEDKRSEDDDNKKGEGKADPKHCRSCDITFNYLPSFIAHKKFYCTRNPPGAQRGGPLPGARHSGEATAPVQ
ncbi:zinc finger protein ush-like isoform X1 [Ischnura elegans]|uniref:zinc finger protein ush-like isoform X1 n=1 Tax=Ischnura elegans TaxID=197161 RepID=UPI001ED8B51A|nr:zinc finger protein ush-like isoform X1 [Ischnura elegans]